MGAPPWYSVIFTRGTTFITYCLLPWRTKSLKKGSILSELTTIEIAGKIENGRVVPPDPVHLNPIALRMAKTPQSFGHSECSMVRIVLELSSTPYHTRSSAYFQRTVAKFVEKIQ